MSRYLIKPSTLKGELVVPPSKSHTLRALYFALMAKGVSQIRGYLPSPDTHAMIRALRLFGAIVDVSNTELKVDGLGGKVQPAEDVIDCGNSGQVLRFMGAFASLIPSYTVFTGDASIRHNRPLKPMLDGLTQLGAMAVSTRDDGYAPMIIRGPWTGSKATISGEDSQPISGILMAASFGAHPIELHVTNPGEKPWIELTLHWFDKFKIPYANENYHRYAIQGGAKIEHFSYTVPGDFSTAAFPIAAALLTHSEVTLYPIDMNDPQGDKAIIPLLQQMGARFEIDAAQKTLTVKKGGTLRGCLIDCNDFVDALPILAVLGCFAEGETEIVNATIARKKESDRIHSIATELKKMGADIEEREDGLLIRQSKLKGATLQTYHDHRLVLSLSVAALAASDESIIEGVKAAEKTYPNFLEDFTALGAKIEAIS